MTRYRPHRRQALLSLMAAPAALSLSAMAPAPSPLFGPDRGVNHVMLWTRDVERAVPILTDKLGFQVTPGGSFSDSANKPIRFRDGSYLELLYALPKGPPSPQMLQDVPFLDRFDGASGFAFEVDDIDAAAAALAARGFDVDPPGGMDYDPDGPGPLPPQPSLFRTTGFKTSPIPGVDPFFVWYAPRDAEILQRRQRQSVHANTARGLTAVWLLTGGAAASRAVLTRMGMTQGESFRMPAIGAGGLVMKAGRGRVVLVTPSDIDGLAAKVHRARGPHLMGLSIAADDLAAAGRATAKGYGRPPRAYDGAFGRSILAPTTVDLGLFIEFHQSAAPARH